jgi:hypothetical protein
LPVSTEKVGLERPGFVSGSWRFPLSNRLRKVKDKRLGLVRLHTGEGDVKELTGNHLSDVNVLHSGGQHIVFPCFVDPQLSAGTVEIDPGMVIVPHLSAQINADRYPVETFRHAHAGLKHLVAGAIIDLLPVHFPQSFLDEIHTDPQVPVRSQLFRLLEVLIQGKKAAGEKGDQHQ